MAGEWPQIASRGCVELDRLRSSNAAGSPKPGIAYVTIPQLRAGRIDCRRPAQSRASDLIEWTRRHSPCSRTMSSVSSLQRRARRPSCRTGQVRTRPESRLTSCRRQPRSTRRFYAGLLRGLDWLASTIRVHQRRRCLRQPEHALMSRTSSSRSRRCTNNAPSPTSSARWTTRSS